MTDQPQYHLVMMIIEAVDVSKKFSSPSQFDANFWKSSSKKTKTGRSPGVWIVYIKRGVNFKAKFNLPNPKPPPGSSLATCCLNALLTALSS